MAEKADFGPFLTLIPYSLDIKIFSKIGLEHFFTLIKFQKNLMHGFPDTDTRTHNPECIGLPA